jgi:hypothetical protein
MRSGRLRDGARELAQIDLRLVMQAPVCDAHQSLASGSGQGGMKEQVWASSHYQQLLLASGTIRWRGEVIAFNGPGMRDHSRGPRGHGMEHWGGHLLATAWFPGSRRGFVAMRMRTPQGRVSLDTASLVIDGTLRPAQIIEGPRLEQLVSRDEMLTLVLHSELGEHRLQCRTRRVHFLTPQQPLGLAFGADRAGAYGIYAPGHGEWSWDGESSDGLIERSARLPMEDAVL